MRNKLSMIFVVFLLPLVLGWGVARAADQQSAGGLRVVLSDGSLLNGAVSFVIDLDTQYGQIKIPSSSLVSARFDQQQEWADVRLNGAELKMKFKPASSDLNATLAGGPLKIPLAKVVTIQNGSVWTSSGTSSQADASQNTPPPQTSVPPPAVAYVAPPDYGTQPPVVYQYVAPPPYYDYGYDYAPYYAPGPYYYGWPYIGFGIGFGGRFHGGFHGGGGFRGGFHGGGFHGGRR